MNDLLKVPTREGVLLSVSVRYWRGCKKLRAEDLGLNPGNVSDRLISLGHKRLLPKEATAALALIEGRSHALVEGNTFPFLNGLAFVADCVATLREQTATLCQEMLESINTCETGVHQKTLNRLVKFIDQFKSLNFVNDSEMEQTLETVRKELLTRTAEEYRDSTKARNQLVAGLSQLRDTAKRLATQEATELVQRFGEMGRRKFHLAA